MQLMRLFHYDAEFIQLNTLNDFYAVLRTLAHRKSL
jgi:hypothetical protein